MEILDKIQRAIFELESLNSRKENIKITTSFLVKRLLDDEIRRYYDHNITMLNMYKTRIYGVELSFDHYSNEIVIYDKTMAPLDEMFKIIIKI